MVWLSGPPPTPRWWWTPDRTRCRCGCLDQLRVSSVPVLVLTHFHADHVDGLAGVLRVDGGGDLGQRRRLTAGRGARRAEVAASARSRWPAPGVGLRAAGELGLEVIGPVTRPGPVPDSPEENDSSLVLMVTAPVSASCSPATSSPRARPLCWRATPTCGPRCSSTPRWFGSPGPGLLRGHRRPAGHRQRRPGQRLRPPGPAYGPTGPVVRMTVLRTDEQGARGRRRPGGPARRGHPAMR